MELSRDDFNRLFNLGPDGADPNATYNYLVNNILSEKWYTFNKELVDFNFILIKYKQYKKWWQSKFGKQDAKYLRADDKMKNVYVFLIKSMYEQSYVVETNERDEYLFGGWNLDNLRLLMVNAEELFQTRETPENREKIERLSKRIEHYKQEHYDS